MKFRVSLSFANAAMVSRPRHAIAGVLRTLADKLDSDAHRDFEPGESGNLRDLNGNTIGSWEVTEK